jgi:hypothetical protein
MSQAQIKGAEGVGGMSDLREGAVEEGALAMMARDHRRMRSAGTALAEAALYTIRECDGLHRLALAVAGWSKAIADEGDRAERAGLLTSNDGEGA